MKINLIKYFPYFLYFLLLIVCISNCFFLDMIQLSSLQAEWYYDNNFSEFLLPLEIDSGHFPLNGMLLACIWKIFGKSLIITHIYFGLFAFLTIYQIQKTCEHFFQKELAVWVALVLLTDATLLAQSLLMSPDIILVLAFFTAIRAIFENKKIILTIALLFASLISMRGMMITLAIFIFYLFYQIKTYPKLALKKRISYIFPFLPSGILVLSFLIYHYYIRGWIGYHSEMPWAECFEKVNFTGFLKNIVIMLWRFFDFGRVILWALIAFAIFSFWKKKIPLKNNFSTKEKSLILLCITMILIISYSFLFHKMLSQHRYLLVHYLLIAIITFILLSKFLKLKTLRLIAIISTIVLLSGNFIKYPEKISIGWDSTLSHLPFYELRRQTFDYIDENNIPTDAISAGFGLAGKQNNVDLKSLDTFIIKNQSFINETQYFLYSNISNLGNNFITELKQNYKEIKKFEKGNVFIAIYEKQTD